MCTTNNKMKKYLQLIIGLFLCSVSFNLFILPNNFVFSSILGIVVILTEFLYIKPFILFLILSIVLLLFGYFYLDKKKIIKSLYCILLFSFFLELTNNIDKIFIIDGTDLLLYAIFGGVLYGVGAGFILKSGFSDGSDYVLNQLLLKISHIGIFIKDILLLLVCYFVFDFTIFIYSLIVLFLIKYVINKILLGISSNKAFYIITSKACEVSLFILNTFEHNIAKLMTFSSHSKKDKDLLFVVIPTREYFKFKDGIKNIDDEAYFVVLDTYEVVGGK